MVDGDVFLACWVGVMAAAQEQALPNGAYVHTNSSCVLGVFFVHPPDKVSVAALSNGRGELAVNSLPASRGTLTCLLGPGLWYS